MAAYRPPIPIKRPATAYGIPLTESDLARFFDKIHIKGPNDCWPWIASTNRKGYGCFRIRRKTRIATRVMFALTRQEPGSGIVCHTCDNPACMNPSHMYLGTPQSNSDDKLARGRAPIGERAGHAKLTETEVREIHRLVDAGIGYADIAKRFGLSGGSHVGRIARGEWWNHVYVDLYGKRPRFGGRRRNIGAQHYAAKLTEAQVISIRRRHAQGESMASLAREFGVTGATVNSIIARRTWSHI